MTGSRTRRRTAIGAGAVAAGSMVANVLGYVLFLVLNRELAPDDLGAVASLLGLVVILGVAALSVQLVAAWRVATGRPDSGPSSLRTGAIVGAGVALLMAVLSPVVAGVLHLGGILPALLVAATTLPTCVTFAVQGVLQGAHRFLPLAVLYVAGSLARTAGGVLAAAAGWGVTGVMLLTTAGAWVVALAALALVRADVPEALRHARPHQVRRVVVGMAGTSALLVASTIDTLVARHVLSPTDSGTYAVLSLFTKAAFWGPAFLATVLYPGMSRARGHRPLLLALGGTGAVVAVGIALSTWLRAPLIRIAAGTAYEHAASLVPVFTTLGGAWALVQVLVYWGAARGRHHVGYLVWAAVGVATLLVVTTRHGSVDEVVWTFVAAAVVVAAAGAVLTSVGTPATPAPSAVPRAASQ
ncbi:O-antigen/teichoic acid export membrane protein [Knoellia remsis]|uniref:O-antigen/teichoic acid export membrane protein n=1 Tax=Knoellia remsis TaxID=407159 RepID=A0A2T0UUF1_9MICO|nr:oligosaccharide flippase family protein [Knoellia remsis]PRY61524.1 O-antigen/teichoic acid export membrane protein [Knoellia remsis]